MKFLEKFVKQIPCYLYQGVLIYALLCSQILERFLAALLGKCYYEIQMNKKFVGDAPSNLVYLQNISEKSELFLTIPRSILTSIPLWITLLLMLQYYNFMRNFSINNLTSFTSICLKNS